MAVWHHIRGWAGAALALSLVAAGVAHAQQRSIDGPFVLHEWFDAEAARVAGATGAADAESAPTLGPGQPPALSMEAMPEEPIYDREGPMADAPVPSPHGPLNPFGGQNRLDERTDRVDSLTYYAAFDPSVIPFKRVVSQNRVVRSVDGEYAVEVDGGRKRRLEVGGQSPPGDDVFWGSFLLRLRRGEWTPIASVAPDQRVVRVDAEPAVEVELARDAAGNHFVRAPHEGLLRLNVKLTAPKFYFSGDFPEDLTWADYDALPAPPLPTDARDVAAQVLRELRVSRAHSPAEVLTWLVGYYRDFDARPFPDDREVEDLYQAITREQIGVCRHRSLSFVITAQALGVPAHYVNNEAHAFVEVYFPGSGWRRIDLGGAADELNAAANQNRRTHDVGRDPLPQPRRYLEEQQRMERHGWEDEGSGGAEESADAEEEETAEEEASSRQSEAPPEEAAGAPEPEPQVEPDMPAAQREAADATAGEERGAEEASLQPAERMSEIEGEDEDEDEDEGESGVSGEQMGLEAFERPPEPVEQRTPTRLRIEAEQDAVRRGAPMWLRGRLVDERGQGLQGREVGVYLGAVGGVTDISGARQLATARTDSQGEFVVRVELPADLAIGRWSLFARYEGDEAYQAATGE